MQWVWDSLTGSANQPVTVAGQKVARTTRGWSIIPQEVKAEPTEATPGGGPLTDAVWNLDLRRIYGVRGGYLIEFDEDGQVLRTLAYADPSLGDDYLLQRADGTLWASHWFDPSAQFTDPQTERQTNKGFYVINPTVLANPLLYFFPESESSFSAEAVPTEGTPPIPNSFHRDVYWNEELSEPTDEPLDTTTSMSGIGSIDLRDAFPAVASPGSPEKTPYAGDFLDFGPFEEDCIMGLGPVLVASIMHIDITGLDEVTTAHNLGAYGLNLSASIELQIKAGDIIRFYMQSLTGEGVSSGVYSTDDFPETNTKVSFYNYEPVSGSSLNNQWNYGVGPRRMVLDGGGKMWVTYMHGVDRQETTTSCGVAIFSGTSPLTLAQIAFRNADSHFNGLFPGSGHAQECGSCAMNGITVDHLGRVWVSTAVGIGRGLLNEAEDDVSFTNFVDLFDDNEPEGGVYGICYAQGFIYCATRSDRIYYVDLNDLTWDFFTLSRPNAQPQNIRFLAGKLWIPCMKDNTVIECGPLGVSQTVHAGFDQPWDIVATDLKVFAIGLGMTPLQEIG